MSVGLERGEPAYRNFVLALFAAGFSTFLQVFDAQALIPAIVEQDGVAPATAALTVSATTTGLAISVLPWSILADRYGRVKVMRISLFVGALLALLLPLVPSIEGVLAIRFAIGLCLGGVPAVAMAYVAEEVAPRHMAAAAGIYLAGNTVGGVSGRLVAGLSAETLGWRGAFALSAGLAIVAAAAFVYWAPASPHHARVTAREAISGVRVHGRDPVMLALYAQGFVVMGCFAAIYNYLGLRLLDEPYRLGPTLVSLLFLLYLLGTVAARIAGQVAERIGHRHVLLIGLSLVVSGSLLTGSRSLAIVIAGLGLLTFGAFTVQAVASGLSGRLGRSHRAQGTALFQLSWLTGTAAIGWTLGLVLHRWDWSGVLGVITVLLLTAAAAAMRVPADGRRPS